jgi:hypothetical protein
MQNRADELPAKGSSAARYKYCFVVQHITFFLQIRECEKRRVALAKAETIDQSAVVARMAS